MTSKMGKRRAASAGRSTSLYYLHVNCIWTLLSLGYKFPAVLIGPNSFQHIAEALCSTYGTKKIRSVSMVINSLCTLDSYKLLEGKRNVTGFWN